MLRVLIYGKNDPAVRYATTEAVNQLGLPYMEITDLGSFEPKSNGADVIIFPETSRIESEEAKATLKSGCSFILINHIPHEFEHLVNCEVVSSVGREPPRISGLLKVRGLDLVPFFYEFPILKLVDGNLKTIGEIPVEKEAYPGVILGELGDRPFAIIAPQIFRSASYLLAGSEATLPPETLKSLDLIDKYKRIDGGKTEICKMGYLRIPIVNVYEKLLLRILVEFSRIREVPLVHKWFYPKNQSMAVCPFHDVDRSITPGLGMNALASLKSGRVTDGVAEGFLALTAVISSIFSMLHVHNDSLTLFPKAFMQKLMLHNPLWNFETYLKIEKQFDAKSSFLFLVSSEVADTDYNFQSPLIREEMNHLIERGWEVALHASFYSFNDENKIAMEKMLLEKIMGAKVAGVTQHYVRIEIPDTWKHHEKAGFVYDASFCHAQEVGFRAGTCLPFNVWDFKGNRTLSILEIPLVVMDGTLFQEKYMGLSFDKAFEVCKELADIVSKYHGSLTLQWHSSIDREVDRSWLDLYRRILTYTSQFSPWYTNGKSLAEWWNLRSSVSFKKAAWREPKLLFSINSPQYYEAFSLGIYVPIDSKDAMITVNGKKLKPENIVEKRGVLLFFFDISKGENQIEVCL